MTQTPEYDTVTIDQAEPVFGIQAGKVPLRVHARAKCEGRGIPCCIHDPSDHHMREWPMNWRGDTGVMERFCPHGTGHPDPDHMAFVKSLTPEHECPIQLLRDHPAAAESLTAGLTAWNLCKYPHLEWQGAHGCDLCCVPPA